MKGIASIIKSFTAVVNPRNTSTMATDTKEKTSEAEKATKAPETAENAAAEAKNGDTVAEPTDNADKTEETKESAAEAKDPAAETADEITEKSAEKKSEEEEKKITEEESKNNTEEAATKAAEDTIIKEMEKTVEEVAKAAEESAKLEAEEDAARAAEEDSKKPATAGTKRANSKVSGKDVKADDAVKKPKIQGIHPLQMVAQVAAEAGSAEDAGGESKPALAGICAHSLFETTKHNRCLLCSFRVSQDGKNSTKAKKSRYVCVQCGKAFHGTKYFSLTSRTSECHNDLTSPHSFFATVNCFTVFHNLDTFAKENPDEAAKIDREALEKYVGQTRVREKRTSADVGFKYVKLPW